MSTKGSMLQDQEDWRARWTKRRIEILEERRQKMQREGKEDFVEVSIGELQQILLENLSLHQTIRWYMRERSIEASYMLGQPIIVPQRESDPTTPPPQHGSLMVNCDICRGRHLASEECQPPPVKQNWG